MAFKSFKGGKPKAGGGAGKVGKPGRKAGRPKGGVFKHKKGGKKGQKQGAAAVPGGAVAAATPKFKPKPVVGECRSMRRSMQHVSFQPWVPLFHAG